MSAIRRGRKHKGHKGVCLYVGNHIRYEILGYQENAGTG